ncbi:MAG: hypothetical protein MUF87_04820 [Anaerolineae bacterium]|jgi:hypothetical protein|nr:hypothetical protein [Anaerolineae bacterium]
MNTVFDYHIEPLERPWSAESEPVTGCDALFSRVQAGWQIVGTVCAVEVWFNHSRRTHIFEIQLSNGRECQSMRVLSVPPLINYLRACRIPVFTLTQPVLDKTMIEVKTRLKVV